MTASTTPETDAPTVSVILPTPDKTDPDPQVISAWEATHPSFEVIVAGAGKGKWSRAAAVRAGAEQAHGDILVIADPDVWPGDVSDAVTTVIESGWCIPCRWVGSPAGDDMSERRQSRGEVVVVTRAAFEAAPPDPRFGGVHTLEADAWHAALGTLVGPSAVLDGTAVRMTERTRPTTTETATTLAGRYRRATQRPARMAALIAEV